jgi:hypothetical protein
MMLRLPSQNHSDAIDAGRDWLSHPETIIVESATGLTIRNGSRQLTFLSEGEIFYEQLQMLIESGDISKDPDWMACGGVGE